MKISFIFFVLVSILFAKSAKSQNSIHGKYNWYDHVTPIVNPGFYHYNFERFGVKWPTDLNFNKFGDGYQNTGMDIVLGFYYHRIGIFAYADLSAIKRGNNAEIDLLEDKIVGNLDTLALSKGNYYHQNNSISVSYPVIFKNTLKVTPAIGWQSWKMISEAELMQPDQNKVLNYYFEEKHISSATSELKIMLFHLLGKKKKITFSNKEYFTQKGLTIEPSYKLFLRRNLCLFSVEMGIGELLEKPFNSTILPFLFLDIGRYQGEIDATVYRIGVYIRYDLFLLKAGE